MTPFTIEEATEICEDFEDLKDTEFNINASTEYLVHDVVISPFNQVDKQKFIDNYFATKDSVKSLSSYTGAEFDVILFAYDVADETDYIHIGIRAFTHERGIRYSFPVRP